MENSCNNNRFNRTETLIGSAALKRLAQKRVCIFGVGHRVVAKACLHYCQIVDLCVLGMVGSG